MKKLALFLFLVSIFKIGFSQKIKVSSENQIIIDSIITIDSIPNTEIYNGIKKWASSNFKNIKEVMIFDSPEEIQYRYIQDIDNGSTLIPIYTTLTIKIKTGKIKLEFSKMSWAEYGTTYESVLIKNDGTFRDNKPSRNMIKSTEDNFKLTLQNILKNINSKNDNW